MQTNGRPLAHAFLALCRCLVVTAGVLAAQPSVAQQSSPAAELATQGWTAFEHGRLDEANRLLSEATRRSPRSADYSAALAQVESKMGNQAAAVQHLQKAIALSPSDAEFRLSLAQIFQTENKDQEALRVLQSVKPDPRLAGAWHFSRGFSLFRIGRFSAATEEFQAIVGDPAFKASASFFLGNIAYSLGDFQKAEPYLADAVELGDVETNKAYNAYTYDYGLALMKLGKYQEASRQFEASIARYNSDPLPWMFLGRCKEQLGDYKDAISALETSIQKDSDFQLSYYELARLQQKHGDSTKAAELFQKIGTMKEEEIRIEEQRAMKLKTGTGS